MKKITFILAICFTVIACKKNEVEVIIPTTTITFEHLLTPNHSMVRSSGSDIVDVIKEQTPNYINVTLKDINTDKVYTCKSNEVITLPIGEYEVSGSYPGNIIHNAMSSTPNLKCDSFFISITDTTNTIVLNIYYDCYVVVAMVNECENCVYNYTNGNNYFPKKKDYYIGFFEYGDIEITLIPYDNSTEFVTTTYNFSTTYNTNNKDYFYAEYGKYYLIHPQRVDKNDIYSNK